MKRWFNIFRSTEASEIAEMAMVLPVMFLVFLGIFWVGRSYNIYATVNHAAREGARAAVQPPCGSCSGTWDSTAVLTAVDTAVSNSLQADRLNPSSITAPNPDPSSTVQNCPGLTATCNSTSHNITVCTSALVTPTTTSQKECGVLVEFTYPIDLTPIPIMSILGNVQIAARAQMRAEQ
jgi:hypothetical protein